MKLPDHGVLKNEMHRFLYEHDIREIHHPDKSSFEYTKYRARIGRIVNAIEKYVLVVRNLCMGWKKIIGGNKIPPDGEETMRRGFEKNNSLRRIEVKRRAKVIEVFPEENAVQKILYLVSVEMNEKYSKKKS